MDEWMRLVEVDVDGGPAIFSAATTAPWMRAVRVAFEAWAAEHPERDSAAFRYSVDIEFRLRRSRHRGRSGTSTISSSRPWMRWRRCSGSVSGAGRFRQPTTGWIDALRRSANRVRASDRGIDHRLDEVRLSAAETVCQPRSRRFEPFVAR